MKDWTKLMISVINDYVDDNGLNALFEELFPGASAGEIVSEMWEAGIIPDDVMERFLND